MIYLLEEHKLAVMSLSKLDLNFVSKSPGVQKHHSSSTDDWGRASKHFLSMLIGGLTIGHLYLDVGQNISRLHFILASGT